MSAAHDRLGAFLQRVPYVGFLGMTAELTGDELTGVLPFSQHLVGNVMLPALHGGVIGAFMEMTALAQLHVVARTDKAPKAIDITIEYLRPGRAVTTYARADLRKVGRRIVNVHVEAWQEAKDKPIAFLSGHFLLSPDEHTL
jgi:uncharacterized protein (TIGR00369 family)